LKSCLDWKPWPAAFFRAYLRRARATDDAAVRLASAPLEREPELPWLHPRLLGREHHRAFPAGKRRPISQSRWHGYPPERYTLSDLSKKLRHLKMVSTLKLTRKFANHENVSANFLEPKIFLFSSLLFQIDLKF
jgi:hypothetical protein